MGKNIWKRIKKLVDDVDLCNVILYYIVFHFTAYFNVETTIIFGQQCNDDPCYFITVNNIFIVSIEVSIIYCFYIKSCKPKKKKRYEDLLKRSNVKLKVNK